MMNQELMEIMVQDWFYDHDSEEYKGLRTYGKPYVDEDGVWCQDILDDRSTYTLRDHNGELILN